jgi:hypothetical protein
LVQSQAFHQRHSNLLALLCLGHGDQRNLCMVLWNMHEGGVNKLETWVQILELFQGADLVLLIEI